MSAESENGLFDRDPGEAVYFGLGGEAVKGTVTIAEPVVPTDDWPDVGESVTFKAVGGEVERTVTAVEKERDHPIQLDEAGWHQRSTLVEYSRTEQKKVIELDDGREVWPGSSEE